MDKRRMQLQLRKQLRRPADPRIDVPVNGIPVQPPGFDMLPASLRVDGGGGGGDDDKSFMPMYGSGLASGMREAKRRTSPPPVVDSSGSSAGLGAQQSQDVLIPPRFQRKQKLQSTRNGPIVAAAAAAAAPQRPVYPEEPPANALVPTLSSVRNNTVPGILGAPDSDSGNDSNSLSVMGAAADDSLTLATREMNLAGAPPAAPIVADALLTRGSPRPVAMHALVWKFVRSFLKPLELSRLAEFLEKPEPSMTFTYDEAQKLIARQRMDFLMGSHLSGQDTTLSNLFEGNAAYLQMYDFINTVDSLFTQIRGLQNHITSLLKIRDEREIAYTKQRHVLASDFRPWPWHDSTLMQSRTQRTYVNDTTLKHFGSQDTSIGQRLGERVRFVTDEQDATEKKVFKELNLKGFTRDVISGTRAKTDYELCCDEALLLSYPVINSLVALSQGLFRVTNVQAPKLTSYADYTVNEAVMLTMPHFPEVEVAQGNGNNPDADNNPYQILYRLEQKQKEKETGYSRENIPPGSWINTFENRRVSVTGSRAKLQAKVVGIRNYPSNYMGILYNTATGDVQTARKEFGYNEKTSVHLLPSTGGAIGYYTFAKIVDSGVKITVEANNATAVFSKDANDEAKERVERAIVTPESSWSYRDAIWRWVGYAPREQKSNDTVSGTAKWMIFPSQLIFPTLPDDPAFTYVTNTEQLKVAHHPPTSTYNFDEASEADETRCHVPMMATHVELNDIHRQMDLMTDHPIFACPRLAKAFRDSGLHLMLLNEYSIVQKNFQSILTEMQDMNVSTANALDLDRARRFGPGLSTLFECGKSQIAVYRDREGNIVDWKDAVWQDPQTNQLFLKPNIDVGLSGCTDLIPLSQDIRVLKSLPS